MIDDNISRLVLSRKPGQIVLIGDNISIQVTRITGNQAKLEICAPRNVVVDRLEIANKKRAEQDMQPIVTNHNENLSDDWIEDNVFHRLRQREHQEQRRISQRVDTDNKIYRDKCF